MAVPAAEQAAVQYDDSLPPAPNNIASTQPYSFRRDDFHSPRVTGQVASRTGQLADAIGDFACLVFLFGSICETASCPVRELAIRELAYPRVVQLAFELFGGRPGLHPFLELFNCPAIKQKSFDSDVLGLIK